MLESAEFLLLNKLRPRCYSVALSPERAALGEAGLSASGSAQDGRAAWAVDNSLRVREDGRDVEAALALDVHEVRVGALNKALELVLPLLQLCRGMQQVDIAAEDHGYDFLASGLL